MNEFDNILKGRGWKKYVWGEIVEVFQVGDYAILKYAPKHKEEVEFLYHPIIFKETTYSEGPIWCDTNRSTYSLDEALITVIAYKHDGLNSQAAMYFCKMIDLYKEEK